MPGKLRISMVLFFVLSILTIYSCNRCKDYYDEGKYEFMDMIKLSDSAIYNISQLYDKDMILYDTTMFYFSYYRKELQHILAKKGFECRYNRAFMIENFDSWKNGLPQRKIFQNLFSDIIVPWYHYEAFIYYENDSSQCLFVVKIQYPHRYQIKFLKIDSLTKTLINDFFNIPMPQLIKNADSCFKYNEVIEYSIVTGILEQKRRSTVLINPMCLSEEEEARDFQIFIDGFSVFLRRLE
jgi:hypothetical protein